MQDTRNKENIVNSLSSSTDGQIERINQKIKVFLQYYVNYQQND